MIKCTNLTVLYIPRFCLFLPQFYLSSAILHLISSPEKHLQKRPGHPHPRWDERPVALVILEPGIDVEPDGILEHCATAFAKWQLPDDILFVDEIPLTSTGKMDKKIVRADLEERGYTLPDLRDGSP